ncbi:MAG: CdaR family protein [Desulfobacterales bacterium]|nr:CdaR family protein [Desulfobacterales bacterium]
MTNPSAFSILSFRNLTGLILFFFIGIGIFLLWPYASIQEADIFIPVDSEKIPEGLIITNGPFTGIEVHVRGPKSIIRTLSDLKIQYTIDLSGVNIGVNFIPIHQAKIPLPNGISILKINPDSITVKVENEIKKKLPVNISLTGKPAKGFMVVGSKAKPMSVILRGSEDTLSQMDKVSTQPINIKGLSGSFKKEVALDLVENLKLVDSSKIILANVFIEEQLTTKTFDNIPVQGDESLYVYRITPPVITIKVKGPVNMIEKLYGSNGVQVYVDLKGLKPGVYNKRATITLPVKTTLIDAKPEIFKVKIIR